MPDERVELRINPSCEGMISEIGEYEWVKMSPTFLRHRYGVDCTTTQTRMAFAHYGLTGHSDPDDGIVPGRWVPAGCEDYEAAIAAHGGLSELNVYSACTDMEVERFTEWGTPDGHRPVVAGIVRFPQGSGCFHLVYVPDDGSGPVVSLREAPIGTGRMYQDVR